MTKQYHQTNKKGTPKKTITLGVNPTENQKIIEQKQKIWAYVSARPCALMFCSNP